MHGHNSASSSSISEDAIEFSESSSAENNLTLIDDSLAACGVSPFKISGKSKRQKLFHANKKIEKVTQKLEKAFSTKGVNRTTCFPPPATRRNDEKDFDQLMLQLNTKFLPTTSLNKKIQILTPKPQSWKIDQTVKFFNATTYHVRTAMTLKKDEGVLSKPKRLARKGIDEETINNGISFN